jgi:hypothetical protein
MNLNPKSPKATLEAHLKKQALDPQNTFEPFINGLDQFRKAIDHAEKSGESEKHFEDPLKDFLKNKGLFGNHYAINSKSLKGNIAIDLAIHNGAKTD